ncbi:uncharacterized protein LOC117601179 [Osmia lignaria lignaria]|uniref:uncharacterized protein LOC117601179 n=1 Tax=Osmia lignaria lignaria TaxID=1437193 RepID=UPI00402B8443
MEIKANSGDTAVEMAEDLTMPSKQSIKTKAKAQHIKASHPPTSEMVNSAIKELKDRKGSSMQAIKKYIATTYNVDAEKFAPFIKRYLKFALTSGAVVQTKGKGVSGSFKLPLGKHSDHSKLKKMLQAPKKNDSKKVQLVEKKIVAKKVVAAKKTALSKKAEVEEKPAVIKKNVAKAAVAKKPKAVLKSMSKAKKTTKAPAAKTRVPKPKKTVTPKAVKSAKK